MSWKFDWNPLFLKDLRVLLRDRKAERRGWWGVAMVCAPAVVLLVLQFAFPGIFARVGRYVLLGYGILSNVAALGAVAIAATAIVAEREKNTYEVLQVSPVTPERLFLGKALFAVYGVFVRQVLLLVPMAVVYLSGGFPFHVLLLYQVVLLATDFFIASLGLYVSAQPHRLPKISIAALKHSATRTQVALQKAMGVSVLFLILLPFYAVLIPTFAGAAAASRAAAGRGGSVEMMPDLSLLGTICPAVTLAFWGEVEVFGLPVPLWLLSVGCNLLLAKMFFHFGVGQLRGRDRDTSVGGRACLLAFVTFAVGLLCGHLGGAGAAGPFVAGCAVTFLFCIVLTPCLSVGELTRAEQKGFRAEWIANSLSPRRLFRSRVSGAGGFLVLLALLATPFLWMALGREALPVAATTVVTALGLSALGNRSSRNAKDAPANKGAFAAFVLMIVFVSTVVPVLLQVAKKSVPTPAVATAADVSLAAVVPLNPVASVFLRLMATTGEDVTKLDELRGEVGPVARHAWLVTCAWYAAIGLLAAVWPRKKEEKPGMVQTCVTPPA
ncbi:MAG: hypothetical protein AAB434_02245 [Planctomycetota bacterium]